MLASSVRRLGAVSCLFLSMLACATPDRGDVQREWTQTLRELAIVPVYPPREDVQVGDVYLRRGNEVAAQTIGKQKDFVPLDMWVASADLRKATSNFYKKRSEYPPTVAAAETDENGPPITPVPGSEQDVFLTGTAKRLRQVAFPDFASMSVRGGSLDWLVPVEALSIAGGANWNSSHEVSLKIPQAESYGLPAAQVLKAITEIREVEGSGTPQENALYLSSKLGLQAVHLELLRKELVARVERDPKLSPSEKARIRKDPLLHLEVLTEVYYARAIDISVTKARSFAGGGDLSPTSLPDVGGEEAPEEEAVPDEPEATPAPEADPEADPEEPDPEDGGGSGPLTDPEEALAALNERFQDIGKRTTPGVSIQLMGANEASIGMRRTFHRPIAVGFRSLRLAVDPATMRIAGIGPASSANQAETTAGEKIVSDYLKEELEELLGLSSVQPTFDGTGWKFTYSPKAGVSNAGLRAEVDGQKAAIAARIRANLEKANGKVTAQDEKEISGFLNQPYAFAEEER